MLPKLLKLNTKEIYDIDTTILFTSEFNYTEDMVEYINNGYHVIDKNNASVIDEISNHLLQEFNCEYLSKKEELTVIDHIKLNILDCLEKNKKVYVFMNVLSYLDDSFKEKLIDYLRRNNKRFINYTSRVEEALLCDYLIVIHEDKVIMEGKTEQILKEEKILKKLGFKLPFIVELSNGLKYYNMIDKTYYDNESLVNDLWK